MKKSILFLAMLLCSLAASATVINAVPEGDIAYYLSIAQPGDIIELADGVYDEKSILTFSVEGLVVKAAEGASPVIQTVGKWMKMNVEATTTFEGIVFDAEAGTDGDNQYGFDISANTTFNDCKFQDYTLYDVKILAETTTFDNCIFNGADVTPSAIIIDGTIAECSIENCEFKNYKDYNISVEDNTTITTLTIDQCVLDGANTESVKTTKAALFTKGIVSTSNIQDSEFKNFAECAITVDKWYGGRFDALTINGCLIHDCTQSAIYLPDAIDTNEKQTCSDFKLTNSTIYNVGDNTKDHGAVDIRDNANIASAQQVLIDHVTIYNFSTKASYGGFMIYKSGNATISNCIAMNPADVYSLWINPFVAYTGATVSNCVNFNCGYVDNGATQSGLVKADPMFVDAANADFMLYAESPAVGMGDPRWGVKAGLQPGAKVLSEAVAAAAAGATITLGDGIYEESSSFSFDKEGLTIVAAEGTNPVVKSTNQYLEMAIAASTTFKGITFDGDNTAQTAFKIDENTAKDIKFIGCEFKNFSSYCITLTSDGHVDELMIDECLFHDCGAVVYMRDNQLTDAHTCTSFKMTNSTAYNFSDALYKSHYESELYVAAIEIAPTIVAEEYNEVLIDHVTLYNVETNLYEGGFKVGANSNATISNCIAMDPEQRWGKLYRAGTGATITNSLYFNAEPVTEGATLTEFNNADPMFIDAANGNFQLFKNSPAVGTGTADSNLGDPRWGVSNNYKGVKISIEPGQAKLNSAVGYSVNAGDTIVLADGIYDEPYGFDFNVEGLVVMAAKGATPVVELSNVDGWTTFTLSASTTFDGIIFDGKAVCKSMLQTNATDISKLAFYNCEFRNYAKYAISNPDAGGTHVDSVIIDNCLFHDGAGSAVNFNNQGYNGNHACSYFKMTNSSVYNIGSSANAAITIRANGDATGAQNKVIIDHITLYNYATSEYGGIAIRKTNDLQITNSIIANPSGTLYAIYHYSEVQNNLFHNVTLKESDGAAYNAACITADPLFVDAANANFMLQATSPAIGAGTDGSNLGDPRWGVAEPSFITLTTGDNSAVIAANIGKTVNVIIERSFTANDGYYTLCVPFNMPASVIGKAYSLGTITEHVAGEGININLEEESELLASMPYLVLPKANMSELVVENVTIETDEVYGQNITNEALNVQIFFEGFYSASGRITNGTTEYYVGNNGYLYNGEVEIRGLSGLFTITDTEGNPAKVRARVVTREDAATGFENITNGENTTIKLIENGQLIIIRNGEKFNAQGQKL